MTRTVQTLCLLTIIFGLTACGGTEKTEVTNILVTPAQQKADLQRARDLGIISEEEYNKEVLEITQ